jgi:hypothetical protein
MTKLLPFSILCYFSIFQLLVSVTTTASSSTFKCFTSENTEIRYSNSKKKAASLPTVRLIQGYYPSQYAMQYAAAMYLTEKIGLNVSFYPSSDPNALSIASKKGELVPGYPEFYFAWIMQDRYDLLFEIWSTMETVADAEEYYLNESVVYGGLNDVYGDLGWFIPVYLYQENPLFAVPEKMSDLSNIELRQAFINAYTKNSSKDYVEYANKLRIDSGKKHKFDIPTYSKPIVFGSVDGYGLSFDSYRMRNGLFNKSWDFVTFGSEGVLSEFIQDLYSKRLPFVASLYSPHLDFATLVKMNTSKNNNTEMMKFQKLYSPRNPSNTVGDICFVNGECAFPITGLRKIANPRLYERFPEMMTFLTQFKMTANDVNDIIGYQSRAAVNLELIKSLNLSAHQIWQYSTCEWLKTANRTIEQWHVDIIRHDCLRGCGINGIGGTCDFYTGKCICAYPELFAEFDCQQSCDGLVIKKKRIQISK